MEEDPTPTQKIWSSVSDLHGQHLQEFQNLIAAVTKGDSEAARKARQRIREIEQESQVAHAAARNHLVKKHLHV